MSSIVQKDQIELDDCISSIDFSPSGDYVAVGLIDETVRIWKADFSQEISKQELFKFEGHMMGVIDVKFNPSGNRIAVSSLDSIIRVWNVDDGEKVCEIQCNPMENWKLGFRDESTLITCGEQGRVTEYNINSREQISKINTSDIFATALATSTDRKRFIGVGNNDGSLFIVDLRNNRNVSSQSHHDKKIRSICFSNNDMNVLTASDDGTAKLIDLTKQEAIFTFNGHQSNVNCVDYCPLDEKLFITCSYDQTVKVWDINKKGCVETIKFHQDNVWAAKFHPTKKIIGSVSDTGLLAFHELK